MSTPQLSTLPIALLLAMVANAHAAPVLQIPLARPITTDRLTNLLPEATVGELLVDFEDYNPGQRLAGQSGWFNITDTDDYVVAGGIAGRSGRHFANGTNNASAANYDGQIMALSASTGAFGITAIDATSTASQTCYALYPAAPTNFLNTLTSFDPLTHTFQAFQTLNAQYIDAVDTTVPWTAGAAYRVAWDVRSDGSVWTYVNGRLIFVGQDFNVAALGNAQPVNTFGSRTDNVGVGAIDGSGDTLTIDNLSHDALLANDPYAKADLLLLMSTVPTDLGGNILMRDAVDPGHSAEITLLAYNTSELTTVSEAQFNLMLPTGVALVSSECGLAGAQTLVSNSFVLSPQSNARCDVILQLSNAAKADTDYPIAGSLSSNDVEDPYAPNNTKYVVWSLRDSIFADGFDP